MMTCNRCPRYSECTELCEEAEKYVNQDFVKKKHLTFTELNITAEILADRDCWNDLKPKVTPKQMIIWHMHKDGLSSRQIGRKLGITSSYIRRVIRQLHGVL